MIIKRSNSPAYFFNLIILLFALIGQIINCDFMLLITYILFITWIVLKKREVFLKYFYFIVITSWMILSVYLIDNTGMWLPNLQMKSYHSGALAPLLVTNSLSFLLVIGIDSHLEKQITQIDTVVSSNKLKNYRLITITAILVILCFLLEISHNNYFSSGAANRFYYLLEASAFSITYHGYMLFLIPILAIYAARTNQKKYLFMFSLFYGIFLILIGIKFGGLFQIIYVMVLTYMFPYKINFIDRHYKKILIYAFVIFCLFVSYAFFQLFLEKGTVELALKDLINRISNGQGDVWWGIYSKYSGSWHMSELGDELGAFNTSGLVQEQYNFGIYKLMNLIAPRFVVTAYGLQRARFAASTEASFYYYFGISGCIFLKLILAVVMVVLVNLLITACRRNKGIDAVLYVWLLTHYTRIYAMSDFYLVASKSALLCIILLVILNKFAKRPPRNRRTLM